MPRHTRSFKANLIAPNDAQASVLSGPTTDDPDAEEDVPRIQADEEVSND